MTNTAVKMETPSAEVAAVQHAAMIAHASSVRLMSTAGGSGLAVEDAVSEASKARLVEAAAKLNPKELNQVHLVVPNLAQWIGRTITPIVKPSSGQPPTTPPLPTQLGAFHQNITFEGGTPVGGWADLTLYQNGNYVYTGHLHDSGATSYSVEQAFIVVDSKGVAFGFSNSGEVHGTFDSGSRDVDWNKSGHNQAIADNWPDLCAGYRWQANAGANWDWNALVTSVENALSSAGEVIGTIVTVAGPIIALLA